MSINAAACNKGPPHILLVLKDTKCAALTTGFHCPIAFIKNLHCTISFTEPNKVLDASLESAMTSITVTWKSPEGQMTGYHVKVSPSDAKKSSLKIKDVALTTAEFEGLTPNKEYKVQVVTVSGETESEKVTLEGMTSE